MLRVTYSNMAVMKVTGPYKTVDLSMSIGDRGIVWRVQCDGVVCAEFSPDTRALYTLPHGIPTPYNRLVIEDAA